MNAGAPVPGSGGDAGGSGSLPTNSIPPFTPNTNEVWLTITNVSLTSGLASLNLHVPTNLISPGTNIYAIWATTNLTGAAWEVVSEVWLPYPAPPVNPVVTPFTLAIAGLPNLFVTASVWTGLMEHGNTVPTWWFYYWYGVTDLSDTNLDAIGNTLLADYLAGVNPLNAYDTPPLYVRPPYAEWNVTDISDPAQPVNLGELRAPFSESGYLTSNGNPPIPPPNTSWHENTSPVFTEAYGVTAYGGASNLGTVFKLDPAGPLQGYYPSELVSSGSMLYGTTAGEAGSFTSGGTIFGIGTNGSGFTNLFVFSSATGTNPEAGLVLSGSTLYGTTASGGARGAGTVFSFNLTNETFTTLYNFGQASGDGANPVGKLAIDGNVLYGTTANGGTASSGTIFEINTDGTGYTKLHDFSGRSNGDGGNPQGALLLAGDFLYGTTAAGGTYGLGTVFSIGLSGNNYVILHNFGSIRNDGKVPQAGLAISGSTLYGTTSGGGLYGEGTVFGINITGANYTILHSFNDASASDGSEPVAGLILSGGTLYGTTEYGGTNDYGMIFCLNTSGGGFASLYSFQDGADGAFPDTALALAGTTLFGATYGDNDSANAPNRGTIFGLNTTGGNFTVLSTSSLSEVIHSFTGADGAHPCAPLALAGCAYYGIPTTVYGTTPAGGAHGWGTVFKVNTDGSGFADLYEFQGGADGKSPQTGLVLWNNTLYGTTTNSIFKINTDGTGFACLTNINGALQLILSPSG